MQMKWPKIHIHAQTQTKTQKKGKFIAELIKTVPLMLFN